MMSRPGSMMMMGGGIGGYMPMSRLHSFSSIFFFFCHFQNAHLRPTSRTGSRPSSGAGGRGPGEGPSGVGGGDHRAGKDVNVKIMKYSIA